MDKLNSNFKLKAREKETEKIYNVRTILWDNGHIDQVEVFTGDNNFTKIISPYDCDLLQDNGAEYVKHYLFGIIKTMIFCYNYFPKPANVLSSSIIRKDMLGDYSNQDLYNIAKETDHDLEFDLSLIENN